MFGALNEWRLFRGCIILALLDLSCIQVSEGTRQYPYKFLLYKQRFFC